MISLIFLLVTSELSLRVLITFAAMGRVCVLGISFSVDLSLVLSSSHDSSARSDL